MALEALKAAAEAAIEAIVPEIEATYRFIKHPGEDPLEDGELAPGEEMRWFQVRFLPEPRLGTVWNGPDAVDMTTELEVAVRYHIPADLGGWLTASLLAADDALLITHALCNPSGGHISRAIRITPLRGQFRALGAGQYFNLLRLEAQFRFVGA